MTRTPRRSFLSLRALAAACLLSGCLPVPSRADALRSPVIAVIKSRELAPYNMALEGFRKVFSEKGMMPSLVSFDMRGDRQNGLEQVARIRDAKPDLVYTVGTLAAELARESFGDTPVLFSMVLDPVANGLVKSMGVSGTSMAGASLDIPVRKQFEVFRSVVPGIQRIGVLYNPQETSAVINEASAVARSMGLEVVAKAVASETDIPKVLASMAKEVDCLWAVSDSTVFNSLNSIQFVILFTVHNRIPFMGLSSSFVKAGALCAITSDNEDNGRQSGELAVRILNGERPEALPVATPRKIFVSLNLKVAEQIGVEIPRDVVNGAKEIFR